MEVQRQFLDGLAKFCEGYPYYYWSMKNGLQLRDMGEVISSYNNAANQCASVTYQRNPYEFIDFVSQQNVAGMLGVFGNIATCTLPHGIVVSQLCKDEDELNVAGDDGLIPEDDESEVLIESSINLLGYHEKSKEFRSDEPGAIALKRPLAQSGSNLIVRPMVIWPNYAALRYWIYGYEDPRYQYDQDLTCDERVTLIGRELFRFLRHLHAVAGVYDPISYRLSINFLLGLEAMVERHVCVDLVGGRLTQCGDNFFWPWIPRTEDEFLSMGDPWEEVCRQRFNGVVRLSLRDECAWDMNPESLLPGSTFSCNSHPHLNMLVQAGYVRSERIVKSYTGEEGLRLLKKSYFDRSPVVYSFVVVDPIPFNLVI
jgi:hypothetical protein